MAENDVKTLVNSIEQHIRKIHDTLSELGIKLRDMGASEELKSIKEHFVDIDCGTLPVASQFWQGREC